MFLKRMKDGHYYYRSSIGTYHVYDNKYATRQSKIYFDAGNADEQIDEKKHPQGENIGSIDASTLLTSFAVFEGIAKTVIKKHMRQIIEKLVEEIT